MTQVTRRGVLAGTASAAIATTLVPFGDTARAAAPAVGKQNASWYRYKVGDFEVTVITDGVARFKLPETFINNVKREEVSKALAANFLDPETFSNNFTPAVINTGSKLIVIDTGTGEANFNNSKGSAGQFLTNLAAAGIDAKAVDTVIITHFHGDHINGLLKADNSLSYPNAEILVPAAEQKYWMDDGELSKQTSDRMKGAFGNVRRVMGNAEIAKRVRAYDAGKEVVPGITALATYGHSPGHTSQIVSSGGKSLLVQGDVTHVPYLFARNPGWHLMFDQDPQMAEATRRKTYDMLATDKMPVVGFHYPFPSTAYIEKSGNGYRETYVQWSPTI
jgi:glyoxylase-like metal-dependent hydrolase (beta-lactamase superfamily II)